MKKRKTSLTDRIARMAVHPVYRAIVAALDAFRSEWGRAERRLDRGASVTRAEAAVGVGKKWLERIRRGEFLLSLGYLVDYLDLFGVAPSRFFRRAFPERPGDRVGDLGERLRGLAGSAYERFGRRYPAAAALDDAALAAGRLQLEKLEVLKKEDPYAALRALRRLAARSAASDPRLLGHALGMLAVTYHGLLRKKDAAACAALAVDLAQSTGSPLLRADALVRGATLVGDQGDYAAAAELMLDCLEAAELAGDRDAVGRALYLRALFLDRGGDPRAALPLYLRAEVLAESAHFRFGALQSAGVAALAAGDTGLALDCLARAALLDVPRSARGFARWLAADAAASLGCFDEASAAYHEARSLLDLSHPADWVLLAVQHGRALLHGGRVAEAALLLREAAPIAAALAGDGVAGAVRAELLAAAVEGAKALGRLERLAARLRAASPLATRPTAT